MARYKVWLLIVLLPSGTVYERHFTDLGQLQALQAYFEEHAGLTCCVLED